MNDEPLLKARDVARILGVEVRTVVEHAQSGDIPCVYLYGRRRSPMRFEPAVIRHCLEQWGNPNHDE